MQRVLRHSRRRTGAGARHRQRAIVLIIALIVLVVMSLAGLVMLRSVGTGLGIAGNVAFKQTATSAADRGIEAARTWILANPALLNADNPAQGYYATWHQEFRATDYAWEDGTNSFEIPPVARADGTPGAAEDGDGLGNRIRFVIHRLCESAGAPTGTTQNCVIVPGDTERGSGGGGAGGPGIDATVRRPYYRITTRVAGPRNTVSYVQVIIF
ncbi:MAG: hypothetical protein KA795_12060 [Burkholderiaceae bacterium]|nr:hypothetical protein [Burkholderiaceae bacterium]